MNDWPNEALLHQSGGKQSDADVSVREGTGGIPGLGAGSGRFLPAAGTDLAEENAQLFPSPPWGV